MSRYASNSGSTASVTLGICQQIIAAESRYHKPGHTSRMISKHASDRLVPGTGSLEKALVQLLPDDDDGKEAAKIQEFLSQQRAKLQQLAIQQAETDLEVEAFLNTIKTIKQQTLDKMENCHQNQQQQGEDQDNREEKQTMDDDDDNDEDYEAMLQTLMEAELQKARSENPPDQTNHYFEICQVLGIKVQKKKKQKKGGNSSNNNDDDDEIEMVGGGATVGVASQQGLPKCPISASVMEDPVRNTKCGHTYSRQGIEQLMRQASLSGCRCRCPVAGCGNFKLTPDQLEVDEEMELTINRAKARAKASQRHASEQSGLVDTDDEE